MTALLMEFLKEKFEDVEGDVLQVGTNEVAVAVAIDDVDGFATDVCVVVKPEVKSWTRPAATARRQTEPLFSNLIFFTPMQLGSREGGLALAVDGLHLTGALGVYTGLITRLRELVWIAIGIMLIKIGNNKLPKDTPNSNES